MKIKFIKLINNERINKTVISSKACDYVDMCITLANDHAACSGHSYDECRDADYAACFGEGYDVCHKDYAACSGSDSWDNCMIDYDAN